MATSTISNVLNNTSVADFTVTATLMPGTGFRSSDSTEIVRQQSTTAVSGSWSLALERTADITPSGTWWKIIEDIPTANGGPREWAISVGAISATLLASLVTPSTDTGLLSYITQAAGDVRYSLAGTNIFATANAWAQLQSMTTGVQFGSDATKDIEITWSAEDADLRGNRLQIKAMGATKAAQIEVVPGASNVGTIRSQILFYGVAGSNYERFGLSSLTSRNSIDSSKLGTGQLRPITIEHGAVDDASLNVACAQFNIDGSVNLYHNTDAQSVHIGTGSPGAAPAGVIPLYVASKTGPTTGTIVIDHDGGSGNGQFALMVRDSSANAGLSVLPNGQMRFDRSAVNSNSANAGANGAVPGQVAGYLLISIAGTDRKVPYFVV